MQRALPPPTVSIISNGIMANSVDFSKRTRWLWVNELKALSEQTNSGEPFRFLTATYSRQIDSSD